MPISNSLIELQLSNKFSIEPNGCWEWLAAKDKYGYGIIGINGIAKLARRVMFSLRKQEIPKNECLVSLCKNKSCINPDHHCTVDETFDLNISKSECPNGCWEWLKGQNGTGYGIFNIKGKPTLVHRIMYERHNGKIPNKMHIMHSCDNPICLNPKHLLLGTRQDNMRDMANKNRGHKAHGSSHTRATINEETVRAIKLKALEGLSIKELSCSFNLPYIIIWQIYNNKSWRHVTVL